MPTRTIVHLMRHGEVHNPEGVLYGRLPGYVLSETGHEMARAAAGYLAGRDIVRVIASPLERAQQTAAPLAEKLGLPIETDPRVIEAGNKFEGLKVAVGDGALSKPRYWPWLWNPFRPSWGEPYAELADRMHRAVDAARVEAEGHEAVIVSHQLPVWTARLAYEGRRFAHDPRKRQCALASLTSIIFEDGKYIGLTYTEPAAHLINPAHHGKFVGGA